MKILTPRYLKVVSICLFIIILATISTGCPGDGGQNNVYNPTDDYTDSNYDNNPINQPEDTTGDYSTPDVTAETNQSIPVITPQVDGNAELNLEGYITKIPVSSQDGASFSQDGVTLEVPPNAVAEDTTILFKECTETPPISAASPSDTPLPEATSISNLYDLGPNGITFDEPVTVTLPYDTTMLQPGYDPNQIMIAYYNGSDWIAAGGLVDPENGTVTASLTAFPGIVTTVVNVAVAAVVITIGFGVALYRYWGFTHGDPLANGNAADFVVPNSPVVAQYTTQAGIMIPADKATNTRQRLVPLADPNNPLNVNPEILTANVNLKKIGFTWNTDPNAALQYPDDKIQDANGKDTNWTPPETYFQNSLVGECTCIANAYLSMFRRLGIDAYGVEGYKDNSAIGQGKEDRHAWIELVLNGQPYYYDNDEGLKPLQNVESLLKRTGNMNGDGQMWNEQGQKPYEANWWLAKPANTVVSGKIDEKQQKLFGTATFTISGTWQVTGKGVSAKIFPSEGGAPAETQISIDGKASVHMVINLQGALSATTERVNSSSDYSIYNYTIKGVELKMFPDILQINDAPLISGSVSHDFTMPSDGWLRVQTWLHVGITEDVYYSDGTLKGTYPVSDRYEEFELDFYPN